MAGEVVPGWFQLVPVGEEVVEVGPMRGRVPCSFEDMLRFQSSIKVVQGHVMVRWDGRYCLEMDSRT